jgi:aryl-alcohol dehydrogenase-like predicted oxidoreductase
MKLALGTVQFGLAYGAFSSAGQVPVADVRQILQLAQAEGVRMLDTAHAYGNSEAVLGELAAARQFRIVTKVPALTGTDTASQLHSLFAQSLVRLQADSVHGLLLHRAADLDGGNGQVIWRALEDLRDRGKVKRIGFSAYGPDEALSLLQRYPAQLIQVPVNVFDTRHLDSGLLDLCHQRSIEVHTRSVFLQGFLLSDPSHLKGPHSIWTELLTRFRGRCNELGLTPLQAALRYALDLPQIAQVVVGVESRAQLAEILQAAQGPDLPKSAFGDLACSNLDLIDPSRWN